MANVDYKSTYLKLKGNTIDKVKAMVSKYYRRWDVEEFEGMITDVLEVDSSTPEDIVDILDLILEQQGGNAEFKRALFTLKAEVRKARQRAAASGNSISPTDESEEIIIEN